MSDDKKGTLNQLQGRLNATVIPGTNLVLQEYIKAKQSNDEEKYEMTSERLREKMKDILSNAIKQFYTNDHKLFGLRKEEALAGRIAHYIECQLRDGNYCGYYADVEYPFKNTRTRNNKQGVKKSKKENTGSPKLYGDIYINSRQVYCYYTEDSPTYCENDYNADFLMVIEVKREHKKEEEEKDKKRIKEFIKHKKPQRIRKGDVPIYGSLLGVFLFLDEKEGATAEFYFHRTFEDRIKQPVKYSYTRDSGYQGVVVPAETKHNTTKREKGKRY